MAAFGLAGGVASAGLAFGAWGQPAAGAVDPDKAKAWLERTFGIVAERVVEATPNSLVVLRAVEPRPPSDVRAMVHLENFSPADPLTPPSSDQEYFVNCPSRRFHVERIESFSQNGARGSQSTSFGPTTWGKAVPNSPEDRIIGAVCGPVVAQGVQPAPIPEPEPLPAPAKPAAIKPPPPPARVQLYASADRGTAQRFLMALPARLDAAKVIGAPEIVEGVSGGHPVFRVQVAGFVSTVDAARFCAAVKSAGLDCFVPPAR